MLELRQTQSLKLVQSPQQILLSSLLQLQIQALELRIHNELEMNPVLELDEITDPALEVETDESENDDEFDVEDFFDNDDNYTHKAPVVKNIEEYEVPQIPRKSFK